MTAFGRRTKSFPADHSQPTNAIRLQYHPSAIINA
jgi:hypothetical protein